MLILLAAGGGALIVWGFVIKGRGDDRDAYMRMLARVGLDPSGFDNAFLAHQEQSKFNGNMAIGFGAFLILGVAYQLS